MIRFVRVILITAVILLVGIESESLAQPVVTMDESGMYVTGNATGQYARELNTGSNFNITLTQTVKHTSPFNFMSAFKFSVGLIIGLCIICLISLGGSSRSYAY